MGVVCEHFYWGHTHQTPSLKVFGLGRPDTHTVTHTYGQELRTGPAEHIYHVAMVIAYLSRIVIVK